MFSIGLTGGIGSGKSTVADWLAEWGAAVVDTDRVAHDLTASDGAAIEPLRAAFGPAAMGRMAPLTGTGCARAPLPIRRYGSNWSPCCTP